MKTIEPDFIVKSLGGITATAKMFEIKPPSVAEWLSKKHIPKARVMYLKLVRPDLFPQPQPSDKDVAHG
jgi:hypothetical protein